MSHLNVEIKARCSDLELIRNKLLSLGADYVGEDHQIDTYFQVPHGRMKLREGNIENSLIHYHRPDQPGPKPAQVILHHPEPGSTLKELLSEALGVLAVVDKRREIFFIGNVKFHLDRLDGWGHFVEIEAIDREGDRTHDLLLGQCRRYMAELDIVESDLLEASYSDMIIKGRAQ